MRNSDYREGDVVRLKKTRSIVFDPLGNEYSKVVPEGTIGIVVKNDTRHYVNCVCVLVPVETIAYFCEAAAFWGVVDEEP